NDFAYKALTQSYLVVYEKNYMRTFIHVRDMGRAFCFALDNADKMRGDVFNVGSDAMNYSKLEVCERIQKQIKCYIHYAEVGTDADQRNYVVSYKKINDLGFATLISLDDGISELARGFSALNFKTPYANA